MGKITRKGIEWTYENQGDTHSQFSDHRPVVKIPIRQRIFSSMSEIDIID